MKNSVEQRLTELEKKVDTILRKNSVNIRKNIGIGDTFEIAGLEWKVLDINDKGYVCLAERLEQYMQFDSSCNNWALSDLRNYLNSEFYKTICNEIGNKNIIEFERDLLSLDGQTEYKTCMDKVSLISIDEYRRYRKLIHNTDEYYWWTLTPDSTKCNNDIKWIRVVSPSGSFNSDSYDGSNGGVRPFCIFSSVLFES